MAVSGSRNFILTRDDLIKEALLEINAIVQSQDPSPSEIADAARRMNIMVLSWQNKGVLLWTVEEETQALVDGTAEYTLSVDIVGVQPEGMFIRRDDNDSIVKAISREDYARIENKIEEGRPEKAFIQYTLTNPTLTLSPIPENSTDVFHYWKVLKLQDFDTGSNNPDFPTRWYDAIFKGLARELAPQYGVPVLERRDLKTAADEAFEAAMDSEGQQVNLRVAPRRYDLHG